MYGSQMITREINGTILGMFEPPTKSYKTVKPIKNRRFPLPISSCSGESSNISESEGRKGEPG
jgi:hypothetical protein